MELGKMRVMKEPNYSRFREILRNPKLFGDRVLSKLVIDSEKVGISQNSFHMVHEGFWDLYCRKPATTDLTSKKLDGWHELIALRVPTWEAPAEPEEGEEPASLDDQGLPVKAVTRIRIPFKQPEAPEEGEEEAAAEVEAKSAKSGKSGKSSKKPKEEPVPEEIDLEDKIDSIPT